MPSELVRGEPFGQSTTAFFGVGEANIMNAIYTFTDEVGNERVCEFRIGALGKNFIGSYNLFLMF